MNALAQSLNLVPRDSSRPHPTFVRAAARPVARRGDYFKVKFTVTVMTTSTGSPFRVGSYSH
jgi:hypothetical protein